MFSFSTACQFIAVNWIPAQQMLAFAVLLLMLLHFLVAVSGLGHSMNHVVKHLHVCCRFGS